MKKNYSNLKKIREKNNISYEEMSEKLGISKCFYWQLEHKKRRLYYDMAKKIAKIFYLKPDDLFFEEEKKQEN